jgi:hypothetical protein
MAHLAKFFGTFVDLSHEMGAPDSKNPQPLENYGRHYRLLQLSRKVRRYESTLGNTPYSTSSR